MIAVRGTAFSIASRTGGAPPFTEKLATYNLREGMASMSCSISAPQRAGDLRKTDRGSRRVTLSDEPFYVGYAPAAAGELADVPAGRRPCLVALRRGDGLGRTPQDLEPRSFDEIVLRRSESLSHVVTASGPQTSQGPNAASSGESIMPISRTPWTVVRPHLEGILIKRRS